MWTKIVFLSTLIAIAACISCICNDPSLRTIDKWGNGSFGAPRGTRKHLGVDVKCGPAPGKPGDVYAPFDGYFVRVSIPYSNAEVMKRPSRKLINKGLVFSKATEELPGRDCFNMFYVVSIAEKGKKIKAGEKIGVSLDLNKTYPGITNHIHVQTCTKPRLDLTKDLDFKVCLREPKKSRTEVDAEKAKEKSAIKRKTVVDNDSRHEYYHFI